MTKAKIVKLDRGLVLISGKDRNEFLQGLISQDLNKISQSQFSYGALLTPQGKFLHDFFIIEYKDQLILDCANGQQKDLILLLSRFKLRANIELSEMEELSVFSVFGDQAASVFGIEDKAGKALPISNGIVYVDPRSPSLGCRLLTIKKSSEKFIEKLAIRPGKFEEYDLMRIKLGIPDGERDIEKSKSTLLECNLDKFNCVDWDKGCYIGQEVTARSKYRGLVKRTLLTLHCPNNNPESGDIVMLDKREVGVIKSSCKKYAIALVRTDTLEADNKSHDLTSAGNPVTVYKSS